MMRLRVLARGKLHVVLSAGLSILLLAACGGDDRKQGADPDGNAGRTETTATPSAAHVVEVTALDYLFHAPDRIPSGWTTFRMENVGQEHHLLLLYRLPEGVTFDDYRTMEEPFERVMEALEEGEAGTEEAVAMLRSALPDWASEVVAMGGPGLVAAGRVAQTTVHLAPGNYVMECYVRTPDGRLHSLQGMVQPLTVTDDSSPASPPTADVELTLSGGEFRIADTLTPGVHTIAVQFAGSPSDVHLARVNDDTDRERLADWLNLLQVDGVREPAPAEFVGGANGMPAGRTSYFTVELAPGRYAWVSAPGPEGKMMEEFVVR